MCDLKKTAMDLMEYIIIARDGHIIRCNADGSENILKKLESSKYNKEHE